MNPYYRRAQFLISAATPDQAPADEGLEVAFAGRSNAGKSSAINALCQQKNLARTSKTPGRTQLLNFFSLDEQRRLVDLPGYGYAKVSEKIKQQWQNALSDYLQSRKSLQGLILLVDVRHLFKPFDHQLLSWAQHYNLPVHILLTKSDKLKRGQAANALMMAEREITDHQGMFSVQLFSALKRQGIEQAHTLLDRWLELDAGETKPHATH